MADELQNAPVKKSSRNRLILIIIAVMILGGGVYYFFFMQGPSGQPAPKEVFSTELPSLTANLQDGDYRRYVRLTIVLEYTDAKVGEEIAKSPYRYNDIIIGVLRDKSVVDIATEEKIELLRKELIGKINEALGEVGNIENLYFKEFLIQ